MMLLGPVFHRELLTTARRRRVYGLRAIYGATLLILFAASHRAFFEAIGPGAMEAAPWLWAAFAQRMFRSVAIAQFAAMVLITPALVAGAIVDERRRKTLHYLLASRLTGGEIVLGKLAARLLHVGTFLAIGLPVMSILPIYGGVDPRSVVAVYGATAAMAPALGGVSILASALARRPRDAILGAYAFGLAWLVAPPLIEFWPFRGWTAAYDAIEPILRQIYLIGPAALLLEPGGLDAAGLVGRAAHVAGWQLACGALAAALAALRLRPGFRAGEGGRRRGPQGRGRPRPACGDDPMLWKEWYLGRIGGLAGTLVTALGIVSVAGLAYGTASLAPGAVAEVAEHGYDFLGPPKVSMGGDSPLGRMMLGPYRRRDGFNAFLRVIGACFYTACAVGVAAAAAGGITGEKEGDTWAGLLASDLTGREILRAKILGSARGGRWVLGGLALPWILGTAAGAVHPLGLAAVLVETAVFLWFAAALGTVCSIRCRTTTRALGWTMGILALLNFGPLLIRIIFPTEGLLIDLGCTPLIQAMSLLSYHDVWGMMGLTGPSASFFAWHEDADAVCIVGTAAHAMVALALTASALRGFGREADRPERAGRRPPLIAVETPTARVPGLPSWWAGRP